MPRSKDLLRTSLCLILAFGVGIVSTSCSPKDPRKAEPLFQSGIKLLEEGKTEQAIELFKETEAAYKGYLKSKSRVLDTRYLDPNKRQDPQKRLLAIKYNRLLELDGSPTSNIQEELKALIELEQLKKAEQVARSAIAVEQVSSLERKLEPVEVTLAKVLKKQNKNKEEMLRLTTRAANLYPWNLPSQVLALNVLHGEELGNFKAVVKDKDLEKLRALFNDYDKIEEALKVANEFLERHPGCIAVLLACADNEKDPAKKLAYAEKVVSLASELPEGFLARAYANGELHNHEAQFEDLSKVLKLKPDSIKLLLARSTSAEYINKEEVALQDYEALERLQPFKYDNMSNHAFLLESLGRLNEAQTKLDQAMTAYKLEHRLNNLVDRGEDLLVEDSNTIHSKALIAAKQKNYDQALSLINKAIKLDSFHGYLVEAKVQLLLDAKQPRKALEFISKKDNPEDYLAMKARVYDALEKPEKAKIERLAAMENLRNEMAETKLENGKKNYSDDSIEHEIFDLLELYLELGDRDNALDISRHIVKQGLDCHMHSHFSEFLIQCQKSLQPRLALDVINRIEKANKHQNLEPLIQKTKENLEAKIAS